MKLMKTVALATASSAAMGLGTISVHADSNASITTAIIPAMSQVGSFVAETATEFEHAPSPTPSDREVSAAVNRGLSFLASIQQQNGSWVNDIGRKLGSGMSAYQVTRSDVSHVGVTALCCMAFVAAGHTPTSGVYAPNVRAGIEYILNNQNSSGMFVSNGSRMYSHAFATMLMAEIFGMHRDRRLKSALDLATEFITKNQVDDGGGFGGWRYEPGQQDADMSITVCQLQAMRAARGVGIVVDEEYIRRARAYVYSSYRRSDGAFVYQPQRGFDRDSFALTAAGVVALQSTGQYTSFRTPSGRLIDFKQSVRYLLNYRPDPSPYFNPNLGAHFGFWYGHYYAAQAIRQYAHTNDKLWKDWNEANRRNFLRWQRSNGAWLDAVGEFDASKNAYATAVACLVLSIPNDYLPIFQH